MKKKLFLLLCLLLILIPVSVWGGEIVIQDGVRYDIEGEEAIASCRKEGNTSEKITIYDYVSIAHVIKIRNNAFMGDRYLRH